MRIVLPGTQAGGWGEELGSGTAEVMAICLP